MGYGLIILEQWQKNENLIDKFLKDKVISGIEHEETLYSCHPRRIVYAVESDFFPDDTSTRNTYVQTAIVVDGKLVNDSMPLRVGELKQAQQDFNVIKEKSLLLKKENYQLSEENKTLNHQVLELQGKKKKLTNEVNSIKTTLNSLDDKKIESINNCVDNISSIANSLEVKANVQKISEFFNTIEDLKALIRG